MDLIRRVFDQRRAGWFVVLVAVAVGSLAVPHMRAGGRDALIAADGEELFKTYCASCHGLDATGNGPLARLLRHAPADLTQLSKKNGGMFPGARVRRVVEGRDVESHGDRDMPIWGDAFKKGDGRSSEIAGARLDAIVEYLASIQHRQAQ
jgi:mono/diheme cytochrome c family protein